MEKLINLNVILLNMKTVIYVLNVKNVKEHGYRLHYQVLLIAYLKLTKKNGKYLWKERILNQSVIL